MQVENMKPSCKYICGATCNQKTVVEIIIKFVLDKKIDDMPFRDAFLSIHDGLDALNSADSAFYTTARYTKHT